MTANLSSGTIFNPKTLKKAHRLLFLGERTETAPAVPRCSNAFFARVSQTCLTASLKYAGVSDLFTASLTAPANAMGKCAKVRMVFPRAGAYVRDVKPPSSVCRRDLGGYGQGWDELCELD